MNISQAGLDLIKRFEGLRLNAYQCSAGVWTIGYGSTRIWGRAVTADDQITEEQAEDFLRQDVDKFAQAVSAAVAVPLNQSQFDALVSWAYNIGTGAMQRSTLVRLLNEGDYHGAADELLRWNKAGGTELAGLTRRRAAERAMFLEGLQPHTPAADFPHYPAPPVPAPEPVPFIPKPEPAAMPVPVALITAAAQTLLPFVAGLFKRHGGDTAERNAKIVEQAGPILVEAAKAATGQTSIEGALNAVASSQVAQEQFRKQVEARWFEIQEAGGGGVEGARKFTASLVETGPVWAKGLLAATLSLIALSTVIGGGAMLWAIVTDPNTSPDQRGMIVGALVALIGVPLTYFFGSSASSRSKDAALEKAAGRQD